MQASLRTMIASLLLAAPSPFAQTAGEAGHEPPQSAVEEAKSLLGAARTARQAGDAARARECAVRAAGLLLEAPSEAASAESMELLFDVAGEAWLARDLPTARDALVAVVAYRRKSLPEDDGERLRAEQNLASAMRSLGDLQGARELQEHIVAVRERAFPPEDPYLQMTRMNLSNTLEALGDVAGACALREKVVAVRERTLAPDHADLARSRAVLALSLAKLGESERARVLAEGAVSVYDRTRPPDDADAAWARSVLATVLEDLGEEARAKAIREELLPLWQRRMPEESTDLQTLWLNLSNDRHDAGELEGARELAEKALAAREKQRQADDPLLQNARLALASVLRDMGRITAARSLQERALEALAPRAPEDDEVLLVARFNYANTLSLSGDSSAARALIEDVIAVRERSARKNQEQRLVEARLSLAGILGDTGEAPAAVALLRGVLADVESRLPTEHMLTITVRRDLGCALARAGRMAEAATVLAGVHELTLRVLGSDHPETQRAAFNLATARYAQGDTAGCSEMLEQVVAYRELTQPPDDPGLRMAWRNLALIAAEQGDDARAVELAEKLAGGIRASLLTALLLSPREAAAAARAADEDLFALASIAPRTSARDRLGIAVFELFEERRAAADACVRFAGGDEDPELERLRAEVRAARGRVQQLATRRGQVAATAAEVAELVHASDKAERELGAAAARVVGSQGRIDAAALARMLPEGAAAVTFARYTATVLDPDAKQRGAGEMRMLAHVLRRGGAPVRVELGPARAITTAVEDWRAAIGEPLVQVAAAVAPAAEPARGVGVAAARAGGQGRAEGERLRRLALDPVLAAAGEAKEIFVCPDDALHLVAFDALPLEADQPSELAMLLGDRTVVHAMPSLREGFAGPAAADPEPVLVLVGGVDYGAPGAGTVWLGLSGARAETEAIAACFSAAWSKEPVQLGGSAATKDVLLENCSTARYLHVATHGWFEREAPPPTGAGAPAASSAMGFSSAIVELAPMTLCGLALAGANAGVDELGRSPGILTAEELARADLGRCELAVLSACETNVGVHSSGQGIHSLQAALHAAGARTAITSLWKVDDEATRALFEDFYARVWIKKEPKAQALWNAKRTLRARGLPPRAWAGWVLSGDAD